jgi:hypothetical protein
MVKRIEQMLFMSKLFLPPSVGFFLRHVIKVIFVNCCNLGKLQSM